MTAPLCTAKRASGWDARGEQPQLRGEPRGLTLSRYGLTTISPQARAARGGARLEPKWLRDRERE